MPSIMTSDSIDILVIGADAPGYATAACAARSGARVALAPAPGVGGTGAARAARPGVSDALWRRLDLHATGLVLAPAPARVSLLGEGRTFATYRSAQATRARLAADSAADAEILDDFYAHLAALRAYGDPVALRMAGGARIDGAETLTKLFAAPRALETARDLMRSADDMIGGFFATEEARAHFAATAMMTARRAPREAGAAHAAAAALDARLWPTRADASGPTLEAALRAAAVEAGVELHEAALVRVAHLDKRTREATLADGEYVRTRLILCSTPATARAAGLTPGEAGAALPARACLEATVALKLDDRPDTPGDGEPDDAVFYIADSVEELQDAHDAAVLGDLGDRPPLSFEIFGDALVVRAPYCPQRFRDAEGFRPWTEQDRQALIARIVRRIATRMEGIDEAIRGVAMSLPAATQTAWTEGAARAAPDPCVAAPPSHADEIGVAVAMLDRLLADA